MVHLRWFALVGCSVVGCFEPSEPLVTDTGAPSSTTDDPLDATTVADCPPGTAGCACYGNRTCDAGLECNTAVELCIPSDCEAGTQACVCLPAGGCDAGLLCSEGVCAPDGATTSSTGDTSSGGESSSTSVDDESSTGIHPFCADAKTDDVCDTCGKQMCCHTVGPCEGVPDCECMVYCVGINPPPVLDWIAPCLENCMLEVVPPEAQTMIDCVTASCMECL